jgi:hypothetical protein
MTHHPSAAAGTSQNTRILAELQRCAGQWVPMPSLCRSSGSYNVHSRISDLRRAGHTILQENRRTPGSKLIRSFYQLTSTSSLLTDH